MAESTALWPDDGNGSVDEEERDEGPVATAEQDEAWDEDDEDKARGESQQGCSTSTASPLAWIGLLPALLAWTRRRTHGGQKVGPCRPPGSV